MPKTFSLKDFPPGFDMGDEQLNKVYFIFFPPFLFFGLHFLSKDFLPRFDTGDEQAEQSIFSFPLIFFSFFLKDFPAGR